MIGRWVSAVVTAGLLTGAVLVGGGIPPSPARIAQAAKEAARNTRIAAENAAAAARRSDSLTAILRNVEEQLAASRRLVEIQRGIEGSSSESTRLAQEMGTGNGELGETARALADRTRGLARVSAGVGEGIGATEEEASRLASTLTALEDRYRELIRESRELARKARAYEEIGP